MVPAMKSNPEKRHRSGPAIAAVSTLALAFGYPLSIGPAMMVYRLAEEPEALGTAIDAIYSPLGFLPEPVCAPIENWANAWADLVS